jgi:hypothetical protein
MAAPDPDQQVADRIARAVRRGRPADRAPTVAQLLRAFGASEDTPAARERVARALALAGVAVRPELSHAPAGSRVELDARAARRSWWPWALAAVVLALAGLAVALAATRTGDEKQVRTVVRAAPPAVTVPAASTATTATTAQPSAAERRRARRAKARRVAAQRAAARRRRARAPVTVRVTAAAPTFLCVEDGTGRRLFDGNLTGARTFRAHVVRLNVGLASTRVVANGKPVALAGSPTGVQISRKRNAYLPLGARPCA